ncbi:MAG: homoserine kinase [Burkholderiaceae bacterium]
MAVFTPVSLEDLIPWAAQFPIGRVHAVKGIASGIENSNFFISTDSGEYVLTIFEKLRFEQLPFYLNLMRHLAERDVLVPAPIASNRGEIITPLHGKPASIVTRLHGDWQPAPGPVHCAEVGSMLAKMHLAAKDYALYQPNLRGLSWWNETTPVVLPFLSADNAALLRAEMHFQQAFAASDTYHALPNGPIHADLFRNNVMFDGERLSGFFDFYFAGCDTWLFDVAVTVNDWCIDLATGATDPLRVEALLKAYAAQRPFTSAEQHAWPAMLRGAALRFWLSRLFDFYLPREAEMLKPHDPTHFERILRHRINHAVMALP